MGKRYLKLTYEVYRMLTEDDTLIASDAVRRSDTDRLADLLDIPQFDCEASIMLTDQKTLTPIAKNWEDDDGA